MLAKADLTQIKTDSSHQIKAHRDNRYSRWHSENLILESKIGKGSFSKVYSAINKNKEECVVKIIEDLEVQECFEYKKALTLASGFCGNHCSNYNVLEMIHYEDKMFWKGNQKRYQIIIMMEKAAFTLYDVHIQKCNNRSPWPEEHLIRLVLAVSNALDRAQESWSWHFDLTEKNILINQEKNAFLLSDFGCSKLLKKRELFAPYKSDYIAPEAIGIMTHKTKLDFFKADVYSLGLILLKMMALKKDLPLTERKNIPKILESCKNTYPYMWKMVKDMMLIDNPEQRYQFKDLRYEIMTYYFDYVNSFGDYSAYTPEDIYIDTAEQAQNKFSIAEAYEYIGNNNLAEKAYSEVATILDKSEAFSKEIVECYAVSLERISLILSKRKSYGAALNVLQKLENYLKPDRIQYILGEDHRLYSNMFYYYGVLYFQLEDLDKAYHYMSKGYEIGKKEFGPNHVATNICKQHMAIIQFFKKDYKQAVENLKSIAEIFGPLAGEDNPDCIASLMKIAQYYVSLNKNKEALEIYEKVKEIIKQSEGESSEGYIDVVLDISKVHKKIKDYKQAFQLQVMILETIRENKDKEKFALGLLELADTFSKQEKHNEAIYTCELGFSVFNKIYYLKHELTIKAYKELMRIAYLSKDQDVINKYKRLEPVMQVEEKKEEKGKHE